MHCPYTPLSHSPICFSMFHLTTNTVLIDVYRVLVDVTFSDAFIYLSAHITCTLTIYIWNGVQIKNVLTATTEFVKFHYLMWLFALQEWSAFIAGCLMMNGTSVQSNCCEPHWWPLHPYSSHCTAVPFAVTACPHVWFCGLTSLQHLLFTRTTLHVYLGISFMLFIA